MVSMTLTKWNKNIILKWTGLQSLWTLSDLWTLTYEGQSIHWADVQQVLDAVSQSRERRTLQPVAWRHVIKNVYMNHQHDRTNALHTGLWRQVHMRAHTHTHTHTHGLGQKTSLLQKSHSGCLNSQRFTDWGSFKNHTNRYKTNFHDTIGTKDLCRIVFANALTYMWQKKTPNGWREAATV